MSWKLKEIAQAVGGELVSADGQEEVTGVHFDSRRLEPGDLFVPILGQRDGHDFAQAALDQGASGAFWAKDSSLAPKDLPLIKVEDSYQALVDLAKWHLEAVAPMKIAITGSNGKTTTKDMVASVVGQEFKCHKTVGNLNNELGVPMTILAMPEDCQVIVVEMGMDGPGQISALSKLLQPDIAIITMIGEAHIEFFGSRDMIAQAKLEILDGLSDQGVFIANGDEPLLESALNHHPHSLRFGQSPHNDIYPLTTEIGQRQSQFTLNLDPSLQFTIPSPGKYNVINALAAVLVAQVLNLDLQLAVQGLAHFQLSKNRLEWLDGYKQAHLLNDAYNASPTSMKAVLEYFSHLDLAGEKIAVLGDLRELGSLSSQLHQSLSQAIDPKLLDRVVLYGTEMAALYQVLKDDFDPDHLTYFPEDRKALTDFLKDIMGPSTYLLLKSSLGTGLLKVVQALSQKEDDENQPLD